MAALSFSKVFPGLSSSDVDILRKACQPIELAAGQRLFNEGDLGDSMLIIESGAIEVYKQIHGDQERVLASFHTGDIFGEMSFVDGRRRSAGARATEASVLAALGRPKFDQISREHPKLAAICFANLASLLADRLRSANEIYRDAVAAYLDATGAKKLGLASLVEGMKPVLLLTSRGETLSGRVLDVVEGVGGSGWVIHFRDDKNRLSWIPYHAVARIEVL